MKYLAIPAAALMLLAAPAASYAQSDNNGGNNAGANSQNGSGAVQNPPTKTPGENNACSDITAGVGYDAFPDNCRNMIDHWTMTQTGKGAAFEGEVAVGTVVPESVEIIEVPAYHSYGYVMLNDHRVLVDRGTRKVIRVY